MMGLLDILKSPEVWAHIGSGLQRVGSVVGGDYQGEDLARFYALKNRREQEKRYRGLLEDMSSPVRPEGGLLDMGGGVSAQPITHGEPDLNERQRGILSVLPPEQGMGLLAQQAFAQPERQIPGRDIPYSPEVLEQQMKLRGRVGEGGEPNIGPLPPGQYTPESVQKFAQTGNYGDLEKYERARTYKVDTETEELVVDRASGNVIARYPKNLGAASAAKAEGEATGVARSKIPAVEADTTVALETIQKLRNHPGRVHGWGARVPDWAVSPNSQEMEFRLLNEQARNQTFIQAFQRLKGGGHVTEIEGTKASEAMERLERAQSRAAYNRALSDLERIYKIGLAKARREARLNNASRKVSANKGALKPGDIEDGYRYKGGDKADPDSWERVQ